MEWGTENIPLRKDPRANFTKGSERGGRGSKAMAGKPIRPRNAQERGPSGSDIEPSRRIAYKGNRKEETSGGRKKRDTQECADQTVMRISLTSHVLEKGIHKRDKGVRKGREGRTLKERY